MKEHADFDKQVVMNHIIGPLEYVAPLAADKVNKAGAVFPRCEACDTEKLAILFKETDTVQIQYDYQTIKLPIKAFRKVLYLGALAASMDIRASMDEPDFDLLIPGPRFLVSWRMLMDMKEVIDEIHLGFMGPIATSAALRDLLDLTDEKDINEFLDDLFGPLDDEEDDDEES